VRQGVLAVAGIRLVPVAPFTVVNLVAGASGIGMKEYAVGTALGLAPGLVAMAVFGPQIARIFAQPNLTDIAFLVVAFAVWVSVSFAIQAWIARHRTSS
jgi:uncharacterized membrane protein YdjX (TVP38/TMEM64 family)